MKTPYSRPDQFDLNSPIDYWAESNARKQLAQTGRNPTRATPNTPGGLDGAAMVRRFVADREAAEAKMRAEVAAAEETRLLEEAKEQAFIHKILISLKALIPFQTPKERKKKEADPFAFTTHLKLILPLVMPVISEAKDPWGNDWKKTKPYFAAPDLLKALRQVELLDIKDIDVSDKGQLESRSKQLKKQLSDLDYNFADGKPPGSDAERATIRNHLVKILEQELAKPQNKKLVRRA